MKSRVDGRLENWPIAASYIRRELGGGVDSIICRQTGQFRKASLAMMPEAIYRKFVKGYSEKQWGVKATELSADLARRFDVREDDEPRLAAPSLSGSRLKGTPRLLATYWPEFRRWTNFDYLPQASGEGAQMPDLHRSHR